MTELTEENKAGIIADRIDGMSFRKIAAKYGTSSATVKRICDAETDLKQAVTVKKEQVSRDILKQLDERTGKVMQIIDLGMAALLDPKKYEKAGAQAIATTLGILIDKYTNLAQLANAGRGANNELLQSLLDLEKRGASDGD